MIAWLRATLAHPDPLVAACNRIALVVGGNGPFYPLYVGWLAGWQGMPWLLLTMCACPFFLAIPVISRRRPLLARVLLPVVGVVNTVFCTWVLGEASGTELFLIPCGTLAALLFRTDERRVMLPLLVLPLAAYVVLHDRYAALYVYDEAAYHALLSMNAISVGCLTIFVGYIFSALIGGRITAGRQ